VDLLLVELIRSLGVPVGTVTALWWLLATGRLVTRREHAAAVREVLFWRRIGLRSLVAAEIILSDDAGSDGGGDDDA
jgi:hypothetical protein